MQVDGGLRYGRCGDADRDALAALGARAFLGNRESARRSFDRVGAEPYRAVFAGAEPVACLVRLDFAHWFGGRPVPAFGVGGVAVAPERRGQCVGRRLMVETLREARADGLALSSLYPASFAFYRKLGYEHGGLYMEWETGLASLAGLRSSLSVRLATDADRPAIERMQEAYARRTPGNLRRSDFWWRMTLNGPEGDAEPWVVEERGEVRGYFSLQADSANDCVIVRDSGFQDGAAVEAALAFLSGWRTQVGKLRWRAGVNDPLTLRVPEKPLRPVEWADWFLRIVDIERAFAGRGYPDVRSSLVLAVADPLLPENAGTWRLEVADGDAHMARTDAAPQIRIGIGALASLYAGRAPLSALVAAGLAEADGATQAKADAVFAGPVPTMPERF